MEKQLNQKVESMTYEALIAGMTPPTKVASGNIAKLDVPAEFMRGTVLAKSTLDGKLYILGTTATSGDTLTPDCILCEAEQIGADADVLVTTYVAGCFHCDALTVKEGYTLTEQDKDKLRERGLYLAQILD